MLRPRKSTQQLARFDSSITFALLGVVLTLLIISLVIAPPFDSHGPDIPAVVHPVALCGADRDNALRVAITRDGRFYLGNEQIEESRIAQELIIRLSRGAERKLYIESDRLARYRAVSVVLDAAQASGIYQVAFLVEQRRMI